MGENAAGGKLDMEIMADFVLDVEEAMKNIETMEKRYQKFGGITKDLSKEFLDQQMQLNEEHQVFGDRMSLHIKDGKRFFKQMTGWNVLGAAIVDASHSINELQKATEYLRVSAALSKDEFVSLQQGIIQTSTITGQSIGEIAEKARTIYDLTGLTQGLDEIIIAGSHMGRAFGLAGDDFERFAAQTIKMADGMTDANTLMSKFDKTVGITGAKMSDLLTHLTQMGTQLGSVLGGGEKFAAVMESLTEYTSQAAAEIQKMGGDAKWMQDIQASVMDPNQWDSIISKMPGMAGNLYDMQQAIENNNMEEFNKLMQEGAQQTVDMASGMGAFGIAAAGIDIRQAELLANLDFNNLGKGADGMDAVAGVLARSKALLMGFWDAWGRLWKNVQAVITKIFLPAFEQISMGMAALNDSLSRNQQGWSAIAELLSGIAFAFGFVIKWALIFLGWMTDFVGSTPAVILGIIGIIIAIKWMMGVLGGAGKAVGQFIDDTTLGVAKGMGNLAGGVSKAASHLAKAAPQMILAGIAIAFLAAGMYLLALSFQIMADAGIWGIIAGLAILTVVIIAAAVAMTYASPAMAIAAAVLLSFAGAIALLGAAMLLVATSMYVLSQVGSFAHLEGAGEIISDLAWGLAKASLGMVIAAIFFAGPAMVVAVSLLLFSYSIGAFYDNMKKVAGADLAPVFDMVKRDVKSAAETAKILAEYAPTFKAMPDLKGPSEQLAAFVDLMVKISNSAVQLSVMGDFMDEATTAKIKTGALGLFGPEGALFVAADALDQAWTDWLDTDITEPVAQLSNFVDLFGKIDKSIVTMMSLGALQESGALDKTGEGLAKLFGMDGFLFTAVDALDQAWTDWWDTDITEPIKQLGSFIDLMNKIESNITTMMVLGDIFTDPKLSGMRTGFNTAMDELFGKKGMLTYASSVLDEYSSGDLKIEGMAKGTDALFQSTATLIALGGMLLDGGSDKLAAIPQAYMDLKDGLKTANVEATMKMGGKAAEAMAAFKMEGSQHDQNVENLLGEIRDLLKDGQRVEVIKSTDPSADLGNTFAGIFDDGGAGWG